LRSRNKAIAAALSRSALIAIFAEHSTRINDDTIILTTNATVCIAAFAPGDRDETP